MTHSVIGLTLLKALGESGVRIFSLKEAAEMGCPIGLKKKYLNECLSHLRQQGWIVALRRGLYALSPSMLPGGALHEYEIAMRLAKPSMISHWTAMHYHQLTQQIPRIIYVSIPSGTRFPRNSKARIQDMHYHFVQMKKDHYFGMQKIWIGDAQVNITDLERTLLDGLIHPTYCGGIFEVFNAFKVARAQLDTQKIIKYGLLLGPTISKRLGWVLDNIGASGLQALEHVEMNGFRLLDPSSPSHGPYNKRWMMRENIG